MEISVSTREGASITVDYAIGETVAENIELFGEEVCSDALRASLILRVQGRVRSLINAEKTAEEITEALANWKIGIATRTRTSPKEKIKGLFDKCSVEERNALLKELKASANASRAAA